MACAMARLDHMHSVTTADGACAEAIGFVVRYVD